MPIYEFVCQECGNEFEKIVSFSATTTPSCPSCQASDVTRRMGRPAIHFKGSGWYITDSKQSNGKNGSGNGTVDKSGSNGADAKSETSTGESTESAKSEPKNEPASSETKSVKADT